VGESERAARVRNTVAHQLFCLFSAQPTPAFEQSRVGYHRRSLKVW
jgi:hypothetical protein